MKRNNRLFHTGLYIETLRQVRMMGLVYLILCLIFAILPPLLSGYGASYPIQAQEHAIVLYFFSFIAPVTLGYNAFGYLTRRNASDFYHSLPVTREATYFSRAAAIATYLLITVVLTVLASIGALTLVGSPVNWAQLPLIVSYHFITAFMVLACTLVGLACSGTHFASFVVAGLALFLPRMVLCILHLMIDNAAPMLYPDTMSLLLDMNMLLPAGLIAQLISGGMGLHNDPLGYMVYYPAHLYTLVIALGYLMLGCIIHNRRRSELARSAAPNRFLQHLYRSLISFPLFLVLGTLFASYENNGVDFDAVIILSIVGLLVYFLYELITTRKWRNLIGAAKVLPIVLILALVLPWLGTGIGNAAAHRLPAREDISSVTLNPGSRHSTNPNYENIALSRYAFRDAEMVDVLYEALEDTIEYYDRWGTLNNVSVTGGEIAANYRTMDVQYNLRSGGHMVRRIRITQDQYDRFVSLRAQDEGFRAIIADLPEAKQVVSLYMSSNLTKDSASPTLDEVWETFTEEFTALPFEQQMFLLHFAEDHYPVAATATPEYTVATTPTTYYATGENLSVRGYEGLRSFSNYFALTSLTPRTLLNNMRLVNANYALYNAGIPELNHAFDEITPEDSLHLYLRLNIYDPQMRFSGSIDLSRDVLSEERMADPETQALIASEYKYGSSYVTHEYLDTAQAILDILAAGSRDFDDLDSPVVLLETLSVESYDGGGFSSGSVYIQLTEEAFEQLLVLLEPYQTLP